MQYLNLQTSKTKSQAQPTERQKQNQNIQQTIYNIIYTCRDDLRMLVRFLLEILGRSLRHVLSCRLDESVAEKKDAQQTNK